MPLLLVASPCTGRCKIDDEARCRGCGRTRQEVKHWKKLDDAQRHDINMRLLVTEGKKVRKTLLRAVERELARRG